MSGIGMVAVSPDTACLDGAPHAISNITVTCPNAGAESVKRVVGDGESLCFVLESCYSEYRAEDLFLEDAHLVVSLEQRRLHVIATRQIFAHVRLFSASETLRAFLFAKIKIGHDFG